MDETLAVLSIEPRGLWLCAHGRKYFLAFNDFPWFSAAPIAAVFNVEPWGCEGLRWPDLDVDLHMASIQNPELYPLISQVAPVLPAVMEAATAMYDGDDVRALRWLQAPAMALRGARLIDHWIHSNTLKMC